MIERPLRGWKDIASFLGTSPRNAQRWERDLLLPIHRFRKTTGSVVSAYPSELDHWRRKLAGQVGGEVQSRVEGDGPGSARTVPAGPSLERLNRIPRRAWFVAAVALVLSTLAAEFWLHSRATVASSAPGESGRTRTTVTLRCTQDSRTMTVAVQEGRFTRLPLSGMEGFQIRATRVDAGLKVELQRASSAARASDGLARVANFLLAAGATGRIALAGHPPINIAWDADRPL